MVSRLACGPGQPGTPAKGSLNNSSKTTGGGEHSVLSILRS